MAKKKRSEFRWVADLASAFGGASFLPAIMAGRSAREQYEVVVGLTLHMGRIRWQRAAEVAQGISTAFGKGALPREYFDAIAQSEEEVEDLEFVTNTDRERAEALASLGMR